MEAEIVLPEITMKITQHTRISDVIKMNKEAIEALASINKHFEKLRNPILRKVLAPRVTIGDAAKIGGTSVEVFFNKLIPLGFECELVTEKGSISATIKNDRQPVVESKNVVELDVRGILAGGSDPFNTIMDSLEKLPSGHTLKVINTFEPAPLIKILNKKGYSHFTEKNGEIVNTYFTLKGNQVVQDDSAVKINPELNANFENEVKKYIGKIITIDVRQLEMPQPMVTILKELETLPDGHALFVQHKKVPQYLLPELAEKGFTWWINEISEGNVQLLIHKK